VSARSLVLAAALVGAAAAGCGGPPAKVVLDGTWPATTRPYRDVAEDWSRHGELNRDYQQVIAVDATIKSPEWRVAFVERDAKARGLDPTATAKLLDDHKAAAAKATEVELIITTWDRRENQLARPDPVWKVTLIGSDGTSLTPTRIVRDKRPKHILRSEFPEVDDFAEAYIATFPGETPVLVPGAKTVRLRVSSGRGTVEVTWEAK
jgi:hypothetical protein